MYKKLAFSTQQLRLCDRHKPGVRALPFRLLGVQFGVPSQVERRRHVGMFIAEPYRFRGTRRQPELPELHTAQPRLHHRDNGTG